VSDARKYWNLCVFESEALEWITELNVSNHLSYLPENVGRFSLGNRMCVLLSDSRTHKEKRWTLAMLAKGKWARGFYWITHRTLPRSRLDCSLRIHLMILDAIASLYSTQYCSSFAFRSSSWATIDGPLMAAIDSIHNIHNILIRVHDAFMVAVV